MSSKSWEVQWAEDRDPSITEKRSWKERKNYLASFADMFSHLTISNAKLSDFRSWWDALTYDQQQNRRSELSKFFQYCMGSDVCTINPFGLSDYAPHLFARVKPAKSRAALELDQFLAIYKCELIKRYPHVKIAMGISLATGLREGDICKLKWKEHIVDNRLSTSIGKSVSQRGSASAAHHGYDLDKHSILKPLINEARELSLKHKRCPFVLSYHQRGHREQQGQKEHISQVTPKKLSKDFAKVRNSCEITWPKSKTPASFHEVRGLFIKLGLRKYSQDEVKMAAAHIDTSTTLAYVAGHKPDYTDISVVITEEMIGGKL